MLVWWREIRKKKS